MIKIKNLISEEVASELETDYYVPLKVEYPKNDNKKKELKYYRIFNPASSFIEIEINTETEKITRVTVVSINDLNDSIDHEKLDRIYVVQKGNPVIDTTIWEKQIIDDHNDFKIYYKGDKLYLLLSKVETASKKIILPHLELLIDSNNAILGYIFYDISVEQRKEFEASIHY